MVLVQDPILSKALKEFSEAQIISMGLAIMRRYCLISYSPIVK
jgi:hypothetical protein